MLCRCTITFQLAFALYIRASEFSLASNLHSNEIFIVTNIPLDQEHWSMSIAINYNSSTMKIEGNLADICLRIECREQRDYAPCICQMYFKTISNQNSLTTYLFSRVKAMVSSRSVLYFGIFYCCTT